MIDAVFLVAVLCGCIAATRGQPRAWLKDNRTAWALLASAAFTSILLLEGVQFHWLPWVLIDVAVIVAIWRTKGRDWPIIALFFPVWWLYQTRPDWTSDAVDLIVSAQLLLSVPGSLWSRAIERAKRTLHHRHEWTNLDRTAIP